MEICGTTSGSSPEITKNPFTIETLEDDTPNTLTFIIRGERNTEYNVVIYLKKDLVAVLLGMCSEVQYFIMIVNYLKLLLKKKK